MSEELETSMNEENQSVEKKSIKRKVLTGILAGGAALAVFGGATTAALWNEGFTYGNQPFSIIQASFSAQAGTGTTAYSSNIGSGVSPMISAADRTSLEATGVGAFPLKVTGQATSSVGVDYSLTGVTGTGMFSSSDARIAIYEKGTAACSTTIPASPIYDGLVSSASFSSKTLIAKASNNGTAVSKDLCMVVTVPQIVSTYTQTATASGDTLDGAVSGSATYTAEKRAYVSQGGDLTLNFGWAIQR